MKVALSKQKYLFSKKILVLLVIYNQVLPYVMFHNMELVL